MLEELKKKVYNDTRIGSILVDLPDVFHKTNHDLKSWNLKN